jgi:fatty acid kinase fatty acid binding subunit
MKANEPADMVRIITDSVAQVPGPLTQELGIVVVPFVVTINETSYEDGINIQPEDLYKRMRLEKVIPKTTAPSPGRYLQAMEDVIQEGAHSILFVALSSNLSGSFNTVSLVAETVREKHPGVSIDLFDTKSAAIAEGYIALQAAQAARTGMDLAEVTRVAQETSKRVGIVVSFDSLEYLALGGRIGKAAYLLGNLIDIKPIIALDREGFVEPIGKVRGNQRAFEAIIEHVEKMTADCRKLQLAVLDADAPDRAEELKRLAVERLKPNDIINTTITPVMGAHTGPGLVGLGYYFE